MPGHTEHIDGIEEGFNASGEADIENRKIDDEILREVANEELNDWDQTDSTWRAANDFG